MNTQRFKQDSQHLGLPASAACHGTTNLPAQHQQGVVLNNLGHQLTPKELSRILKELRKDAAPGIDGVTYKEFSKRKQDEILKLTNKLLSRTYRCQPNRRVMIPKPYDVGFRMLGIPSMVDKLAQGAIKWILEPIYERIFYPESYGYRPGRSCHQAINDLKTHLISTGGGFIIDADLSKFFDSVPHKKLMAFIEKKVKDPVILHAIRSFLCAGTMVEREDQGGMELVRTGHGTPQGGVISPLLANIYLHYVLDEYIIREISPTITAGGVKLFRYADDFVCVVSTRELADELLKLIEVRLVEYGLSLNLGKTSLMDYRRPDLLQNAPAYGVQCFKFLGFDLRWELDPIGNWKILGCPAKGRTQKALDQAMESIKERAKEGYTPKKMRNYIAQLVSGFSGYYSIEGCQEEVNLYRSEMAKILDSI